MTPAEHYRRAEELLAAIDYDADESSDYLRAQAAAAHATLAGIPVAVTRPERSWSTT